MKRSEMIKRIHNTLVNTSLPIGNDWAEELLDIMEEVGMQPPIPDSLVEFIKIPQDTNGWEPEEYEGSKHDPEGEWGE